MARSRAPFASQIPKPLKRSTGRATVSQTPLHVRTTGGAAELGLNDYVRAKLGRKLGKFAESIERVSVRFEDVNGPRGGVDKLSRIKLVFSGAPSVVVESPGENRVHAFDQASQLAERAARRHLGKLGMVRGRDQAKPVARPRTAPAPRAKQPSPPEGSLIGRRVGRSKANLERTLEWSGDVDTSLPGVSASDQKAGGASTAARNVKRSTSRATATLEDSATGQPSRKSTRKSANRAKAATQAERQVRARASAPRRRATQARARRGSAARLGSAASSQW